MSAPARAVPAASTSRVVRTTVALLFAAWLIDYVDRLVINLVLPSIGREFHLDHGQQGLVVSAFFLAYALAQIPGGMLADRLGARRVALWALVAWSVFTALTGFAWSFVVLLALRLAFGTAQGVFPPASMKVLVERTTPEGRMRANGVIMSSNALAGLLTALLVPPLIAVFGWRSAFFSTAALGVLVVVAMRAWLPAPLPQAEPEPEAPASRPAATAMLRQGVLWRFSLIMLGYSTIIWGLNTWVPTYLSEERGISLTSAGLLTVFPVAGGAAATIIGGRLVDRLEGHHRKIIVPGMALTALSLPLMAYSTSLTWFVLFGTLAVTSAALTYMPIFAVPLRGLPTEYVGVGSAVIVVGGQIAGMATPPVMGVIADTLSFEAAFAFLALGALLAAVMAVATPQTADALRAALRLPLPPRTPDTKESQ
ncbi:MFS transporter [Streptomyces sp. NPDC050803]|uniref:MFS transporter n=1 Tax=unclassified Streptomyces TaxID=2593676 RepID=UPI003442BB0B